MLHLLNEQSNDEVEVFKEVGNKMAYEFPVASLSQNELKQIKSMEEKLRDKTGQEIVLIAYENKHKHEKG
ncbi:hypothetical protein ACFSYB_17250 [Litchfieldia salsa]